MRTALFAAAAALLSACATMDSPLGGGRNFAEGSELSRLLSGADEAALAAVFVEAVERGERGAAQEWRGPRASGTVTPGDYLVGNLWSDPLKVMRVVGRIDLSHPVETELGLYAVAKTANVRAAPLETAPVLTQLSPGAAVDVVGKAPSAPWMLVAHGGAVRGYVHESLLLKAPGAELELAGGPTRKPVRCREFSQSLSVGGQNDRFTGVACDRDGGWRIEAATPVS